MSKAERLAVLGGGMSSLSTVFALTNLADWREKWSSITVYQLGWRLGGKGASGRNAGAAQRIEEHGLHLLFGCYENTFRILDRAYTEMPWQAGETRRTLDDALEPHDHVVMFEPGDTGWEPWPLTTVRRDGYPGRGTPVPLGPGNYIDLLLRYAIDETRRWLEGGGPTAAGTLLPKALAVPLTATQLLAPLEEAAALARAAFHGSAPQSALAADASVVWDSLVARLVGLCERALAPLRAVVHPDRELRHAAIDAEFALTVVKGLLHDGVLAHGRENWSAIDGEDLRQWLARHGASRAVTESAPTRGLYAAVFSDGHRAAAGSLLHALVRASHFKGAAIYKMKAGMGDTIFAPLYRVLRARGVRFEFFHRVESIGLSDDRHRVERVRINRQVRLRDPDAGYQPLVTLNGRPCWPNRPRVEELAEEEADIVAQHDLENWWDAWAGREDFDLVAGRDFDRVLLGIGVGAFPDVCRELIEDPGNPCFARMVSAVQTRATQAAQLWMCRSAAELGWNPPPVVIPYQSPFDTWAEMSHLLPEEQNDATVTSLAYLCTGLDDDEPLPPPRLDPAYPDRQRARVRANLQSWFEMAAPGLWSAAMADGHCDWNVLHDPEERSGPARLDAQYWLAVQNPSDRYVMAAPGSTAHRLRPEESGYPNLVLTGDWTLNDMNVGCLEAATMSALRSARVLDSLVPLPVYGWLPDAQATRAAPAADSVPPASARRAYVPRDGEMLVVPPVDLDVQLTSFFVAADPAQLAALCDRELNLGGTRRYRPAGPFVVFYCSTLDNRVPEGSIEEIDFGVWVPVFAGYEDRAGFRPERLLTYSPYVWVSNSPALVGGRSVFGFPKHVARLVQPGKAGDPARFLADTWIVDAKGGRAREARLLEIERRDASQWPERGGLWNPRGIAAIVARLLRAGEMPPLPTRSLLSQLLHPTRGMPMVFLKQIPAVDGSTDAAYQAVIEAPVEIQGTPLGGAIDGRWQIAMRSCFSHDIAGTCGIPHKREQRPDGEWCVVPVLAQGWMEFQSRVQPGRVTWEAPR